MSGVWSRRRLRENWRRCAPAVLVFVAAAVAFRASHLEIGYWAIDDAAITYAAALELADHGSLAIYVEGPPIEGYSNPIVFFVTAVLQLFGIFDPITTHSILEPLLFGVMTLLAFSLLRWWAGELAALVGATVFVALELVTPSTWLWYASGLENLWLSTGLMALLWICVRTARGVAFKPAWGVFAFLVGITRPEGPVYVAAFFGALLVFARPVDLPWAKHVRQVAFGLAVTVALYLAFVCWRRIAYEAWWPNTYYAKLGEARPLFHIRRHVIPVVLPYFMAGLLAATVVPLLALRIRMAPMLAMFLLGSLAMPVTAGEDWMGWHRFCTPFLAMAHVTYAAFAAALLAWAVRAKRRAVSIAAVAAVLVIPVKLFATRVPYERESLPLNAQDVTIASIGRWSGGLRWEQQMRAGVPNAVVMMPDAGGSLIVGGMQFVDSAGLTDFHMARVREPHLIDQYQDQERRPDLVRDDPFVANDEVFLREHFLRGDTVTTLIKGVEAPFLVRRDLVELSAIEPQARLLYEDAQLRLYASAETVPFAAPRGLVRCELLVVWAVSAVDGAVRMQVDGGDRDEISLRPYQAPNTPSPTSATMQRRALLLGAPDRAGTFGVTLEIIRPAGVKRIERAFTLEVATDNAGIERAIAAVSNRSSPVEAMRRVGRLREQLVPRHGMTTFRASIDELGRAHLHSLRSAGRELLRLRSNARLAGHERQPAAMRRAEAHVARAYLATCLATSDTIDAAARTLCVGRAIDELRRYGYFNVLSLAPEVAKELRDVRGRLSAWPLAQQYRALLGLTLAIPSDMSSQQRLLARRRDLGVSVPKL